GDGLHVALGEEEVVDRAGRAPLVVPGRTGGAEGEAQLVIPADLRCPRVPRLGGIEQHRDVVDAAVDHASLVAHDVRDRVALVGRGGGDLLGRGRVARIVALELTRARLLVLVRI